MRAAAAPETDASALPPLFRHHIRRPRLTRLLDASTSRIIVLAAPAGYGKTTLAAEWLQGRPKNEVAWYYASSASADVAALSVGIAEAVSHILPAGDRVRQRLRVPQVPDNTADILAELLAADLMKWPDNAWLVVDDYHHAMESKSAERFVEELVRLAPIRLLITTRRRPSWATARRVVYGEIQELTVDQLAMTPPEASPMLLEHGRHAAKSVIETARGWPAFLGLATRAPTTAMREKALAETQFRFLAEEVLARLTDRERHLARQASVPPTLSEDLLEVCLEDFNGAADLEVLRDLGLVQEHQASYALHPLLRQFLREELRRLEPGLARQIARRAAHYLQEHGEWESAFTVAADAGEFDLARGIATLGASTLIADGRLETLDKWLHLLSRAGRNDPELDLVRAEVLLRRSHFTEAAAMATLAIGALPKGSLHEARGLSLLGEAHHLRSDSRRALAHHRRALHVATNPDDARRAAWGAWTAAHQLEDEDCAKELLAFKTVMGSDITARLRAAVAEALVRERLGTYAGSEELFAMTSRLSHKAIDPMAVSGALAMAAYHRLMQAEYRKCDQLLDELSSYSRRFHLIFARGPLLTYQVATRIGLRQFSTARALLIELSHFAEGSEDPLIRLDCDTLDRLLRILSDHDAPVEPADILPAPINEQGLPINAVAERAGLQALVLASNGFRDLAIERANALPLSTATPVTRCFVAFTIAVTAINDGADATLIQDKVGAAIRLARDIACLDSLVTAYRLEPRLLEVAARSRSLTTIVRPVVSRANDTRLARERGIVPSPTRDAFPAGLTRRELEVMHLLSSGMTNSEIAKHLYISRSTAKVHVHHIFKKLGVQSRLQAVARWRELTND